MENPLAHEPGPDGPGTQRGADEQNITFISGLLSAAQAAYAQQGCGLVPVPPPVHKAINVLIVMDGQPGSDHYATFGYADQDPTKPDDFFGLGRVIDALTDRSNPSLVPIDVWRAQRDTDVDHSNPVYAPNYENFRFGGVNLDFWAGIWLIGLAVEGGTEPLADDEIQALAGFMNRGGVFATGDHEDLGVLLCGKVPPGTLDAQVVLSRPRPQRRARRAVGAERGSNGHHNARARRPTAVWRRAGAPF